MIIQIKQIWQMFEKLIIFPKFSRMFRVGNGFVEKKNVKHGENFQQNTCGELEERRDKNVCHF